MRRAGGARSYGFFRALVGASAARDAPRRRRSILRFFSGPCRSERSSRCAAQAALDPTVFFGPGVGASAARDAPRRRRSILRVFRARCRSERSSRCAAQAALDPPGVTEHHPSQPHRIPMRIVTDASHQTCPERVSNNVSGGYQDIFIPSQRSVVVTRLPDRPPLYPRLTQCVAGLAFETLHQGAQCCAFELQQPMHMIWHYHPGHRSAVPSLL